MILGIFKLRSKPSTAAEAIEPLLKVQANLDHVSSARRDLAADKTATANALLDEARADTEEAVRAEAILTRLETLTEGDE